MATDLLSVGEEFAELDLVVRQLDDGSLTVSRDDTLPDDGRLRVSRTPDGSLEATLLVGPAAAGAEVKLMAGGLPRGEVVVRDGKAFVEAKLQPSLTGHFTREALCALFEEVQRSGQAARGRLGSSAPTTAIGPAADPTQAKTEFVPLDGPAPKNVPVARPTGKLQSLPSSYLRGAGQSGGETTTQRYGPSDKVPGRAELAEADRRASERLSARAPSSAGGGAGLALGIGALLLVGAGAVAVVVVSKLNTAKPPAPVTPTPATPTTPAPDWPDAPTPDAPSPDTNPATPDTPRPTPRPSTPRPGTSPRTPQAALTEAEVLARVKDPARRADAVEAWLAQGLDQVPGARLRVLEALGPDQEADPRVGRALAQSLHTNAPPDEVIACLPLARGSARRAAIQVLGEPGPAGEKAAAALAAAGDDTEDLLIEEALAKLGHPREGAALRLTTQRGKEWALWGDGHPLLEQLGRRGVANLAPLFEHPEPEVRALACELIAHADQPNEALPLIVPRLKDPAPEVRQRAVEGIVALNDPRAAWPLARALAREEPGQVRDSLRDALGRLPTKETATYLGTLLERPDANDRRAAVVALNALAKVEGVPLVVKALDDPDRAVRLEALRGLDLAHRQPALRAKVAEGLSAIRRIGLDRSDRELCNIARNLHLAIAGRMPEDTVRHN